MNTEYEVKEILGMGTSPEKRAKLIMRFTIFKEEDIIAALKKGGRDVSEIYRTLLSLNEKSNISPGEQSKIFSGKSK